MAKKKNQKTSTEMLQEMADGLGRMAADLGAFLTGDIGPTQQEYIDKINANWNGYNFIVVFGHVYRLTNEKRYKENGSLRCPCEVCELKDACCQDSDKTLCGLLSADTDEYFYDAGELVIDKRGKMKVEKWFEDK
jgi:hypothetical protein